MKRIIVLIISLLLATNAYAQIGMSHIGPSFPTTGIPQISAHTVTGTDVYATNFYGDTISATTVLTSYCNTVTVAKCGGDYTTIQAALDASGANTTFLVYPGTYTDDTIHFTANNQCVRGMTAAPKGVLVTTANQNIVDFGAYTGCKIYKVKMTVTAGTTLIATVQGSTGSCNFKECHVEMTTSYATAGIQPVCYYLSGAGTIKVKDGTIDYNHTGVVAAVKNACLFAAGATADFDHVYIDVDGSGASSAITPFYSTGALTFDMNRCEIDIDDTDTSYVVGVYTAGTGMIECRSNNIHVDAGGAGNTSIGVYVTGTPTVRCMYNHIHATDTGGSSYAFNIGAGSTLISQFDDIIAADGNTIAGTFTEVSSNTDGSLNITDDLEVDDTLDVDGHSAFGADGFTSNSYVIDIDETFTHQNTTRYGIFMNVDHQPAGALGSTTPLIAADIQADWHDLTGVDGSTHAYMNGVKGEANNVSDTGAINELIGTYGKARSLGASAVTKAIGIKGEISNDDVLTENGNITTASSLLASGYTDKGTGTITTRYGLEIEDVTGGGNLTNNVGIYCPALTAGGTSNLFINNVSADSDFGSGDITTTGTLTANSLTDGTATLTGGSLTGVTGGIQLDADNAKLYFGAGDDVYTEFDGTDWDFWGNDHEIKFYPNSYMQIWDADLYIYNTPAAIYAQEQDTDLELKVNVDGTPTTALSIEGTSGDVNVANDLTANQFFGKGALVEFCQVSRATDYTPSASTWTQVPFDREDSDAYSMYSSSPSQFTTHGAGLILVTVNWRPSAAGDATDRKLIRIQNSNCVDSQMYDITAVNNHNPLVTLMWYSDSSETFDIDFYTTDATAGAREFNGDASGTACAFVTVARFAM